MSHCTVCHHPQHQDINQALLSGDVTQQSLCHQYGLSSSAMSRHKDHLVIKMNRANRRLREIREQGAVFLLNEALESTRRSMAAAEADNDYMGVFRGANTVGRLIHQIGRLEGSMKLDTLYRLLTSPAWKPAAALLPADSSLLTGLHQALIDDALVSCPESAPEISAAADLPLPETRKSALDNPMARLRLVQNLLPDLDLSLDDITPDADPPKKPWKIPSPESENCLSKDPPAGPQRETTGKPAGNDREMSGKSAGKTAADSKKVKQYRKVKRSTKKSPGIPAATLDTPCFGRDPQGGDCQSATPPALREAAALPVGLVAANEGDLPSPKTANRKPQTVFPEDLLEILDNSQATLNEVQAAELAAYLAAFPPYAKANNRAPSADPLPTATPETVSSPPASDFLITAHKRPAFLAMAPGPDDPSSAAPSAPDPCPAGPASADPDPFVPLPPVPRTAVPAPPPRSGRPPDPPNFGARIFRNLTKYF